MNQACLKITNYSYCGVTQKVVLLHSENGETDNLQKAHFCFRINDLEDALCCGLFVYHVHAADAECQLALT